MSSTGPAAFLLRLLLCLVLALQFLAGPLRAAEIAELPRSSGVAAMTIPVVDNTDSSGWIDVLGIATLLGDIEETISPVPQPASGPGLRAARARPHPFPEFGPPVAPAVPPPRA